MKTYELTYIISPEISSEEIGAKAKEIETLVQGEEGIILKHNIPTAKVLAYPVKKRASGFLGTVEFQLDPEKMAEIKEVFSKDGKIVRQMVIIKEIPRVRKLRRTKTAILEPAITMGTIEPKVEPNIETTPETEPAKEKEKEKIELKDIDQQLDEILGE